MSGPGPQPPDGDPAGRPDRPGPRPTDPEPERPGTPRRRSLGPRRLLGRAWRRSWPGGQAESRLPVVRYGRADGSPPRGCRCCLVVFGGALFFLAPFAVVTVFLFSMSSSPDDSVRDWLDAVREGRFDAAVHQMCPRYRDSLSAADLQRLVGRSGGVAREQIGRTVTRSENRATVQVTVTGTDGHTRRRSVSVVRDGDLWRVCSLP